MRTIKRLVLAILLMTQVACGTLLYPERQNQPHSGQLDPTVLLLNTAGLFVFIVPGLLAFAVDFSNGTIFLPNASFADNGSSNGYRAVNVEVPMNTTSLNDIVREHTSLQHDIRQEELISIEITHDQISQFLKTTSPRSWTPSASWL